MPRTKIRVLSVFGTRPEAIKMAPVIHELRRRAPQFESLVCLTGQHKEMLSQVMEMFELSGDFDLALMKPNQDLYDITLGVLSGVSEVIADCRPDVVLVHGDTTTTFAGALAGLYAGVPISHVEAGLRTNDKHEPFPEEINRRLCDSVCDLYFAPTESNAENLRREGCTDDRIQVVGNTVIDALLRILPKAQARDPEIEGLDDVDWQRRTILVTAHRRESLGKPMEGICRAVRRLCAEFPDINVVFPMHRNPKVREVVRKVLGDVENCRLIDPVDYLPFVWLMDRSHIILTDSGGIQEEAPSLNKPVLVVRNKTERQEAVDAGTAKLIGTKPANIHATVADLLTNPESYWSMAKAGNPYGDGKTSIRIVNALYRRYGAAA